MRKKKIQNEKHCFLKKEELGIVVIAIIILISIISFLTKPEITGFVAYSGDAAVWDFSAPGEYIFNSSELQVSSGAQLIKHSKTITWAEEVTSTASITAAVYDRKDKLSEVNSKDGEWLEINKNKIFDVTFSHLLYNEDVIHLYLKAKGESRPDIFICDASTACDSPGYGLVHFDGAEGWYEITLSGMSSPASTLNIDPEEDERDFEIMGADNKVKLDYVEAQYTETIEHSNTTEVYPDSSVIETDDSVVENLGSWKIFSAVEILNGQSINYFYSSDSGMSWTAVSAGDNLSSIESNKIRFKAELNSDGSATPMLTSLSTGYSLCVENWVCTGWSECIGGIQTRVCTDSNNCGAETNKPNETQSCEYNCIENWSCTAWSECTDEIQTRICEDLNSCGTEENKLAETQNCTSICAESWNCSAWAPEVCPENETQSRVCLDMNSCGTEANKSAEVQDCTYIFNSSEPKDQSTPQQVTNNAGSGGPSSARESGSHRTESTAEQAQPLDEAKLEEKAEQEKLARKVIQESAAKIAGATTKVVGDIYHKIGIYSWLIMFIGGFVLIGVLTYIRKRRI